MGLIFGPHHNNYTSQMRASFTLSQQRHKQVCRSWLLSGRNVRWPRRILPLVSQGEYANGTDGRRTDARPLHFSTRNGE